MHVTDDRAPANETPKLAASRMRLARLAAAAIFALLAALCCTPLMQEGWFTSHERIRPIARAFAAYLEVANGDLYPRWLALGYVGKGVPLFDFYPPAFSLLVAWAHALGVPLLLAAKLLVYGIFFIGAFGVYAWVRPHLGYFPALLRGDPLSLRSLPLRRSLRARRDGRVRGARGPSGSVPRHRPAGRAVFGRGPGAARIRLRGDRARAFSRAR